MVRALSSVLMLSFLCVSCIVDRSQRPDVSLRVDAATQYNHRGMVQNDNGVVQGEANVALPLTDGNVLDLNVWGNMDLRNDTGDAWMPDGNGGHFSEIDVKAAYSRAAGDWDLTGGLLSYNPINGPAFPFGARGPTTEFFVTVGREVLALYSSLTLHYDFDQIDGMYLNGSLSKGFEINPRTSADVEVSLGYSDDNHSEWTYGVPASGLADLQARAGLSYAYNEFTTLRASLAASTIIDNDIGDWFDALGIEQDNVWASVGVEWSF